MLSFKFFATHQSHPPLPRSTQTVKHWIRYHKPLVIQREIAESVCRAKARGSRTRVRIIFFDGVFWQIASVYGVRVYLNPQKQIRYWPNTLVKGHDSTNFWHPGRVKDVGFGAYRV